MRTSAGDATLLPHLLLLLLCWEEGKVLKSAKKVNRNGQSEVHLHRRWLASKRTTQMPQLPFALRCRNPFSTPRRGASCGSAGPPSGVPSSLLFTVILIVVPFFIAVVKVTCCTPSPPPRRPRQMHPHPSVRPSACRSPSVAKWNLCVTAARSRSCGQNVEITFPRQREMRRCCAAREVATDGQGDP